MNSKSTGNSFEREISKDLSLWVSNGKDDDIFWRDMSSGSRATVRKKISKESKFDGDLVVVDLKYKEFTDLFFIDTKSYKNFNPLIINTNNIKSNNIFKQWLKVINDCPKDKIPLMICKIRDRVTPNFFIIPFDMNFNCQNVMIYKVFYDDKEYNFNLVLQSDFLKNNNYQDLIMNNKKEN